MTRVTDTTQEVLSPAGRDKALLQGPTAEDSDERMPSLDWVMPKVSPRRERMAHFGQPRLRLRHLGHRTAGEGCSVQ